MALFDIFKKKQTIADNEEGKTLLAFAMFNNGNRYDLNTVIEHFTTFWGLDITDTLGDNTTAVFNINGERVALAYMPVPIPWSDIKHAAQYAYNWTNAEKDLESHDGHAIVTVMSATKETIDRFKVLSKLLCSILMTSNCIGVYNGNGSFLISTEQYLENAEYLKEGDPVVPLWVYIGLRESDVGNSAYTNGLAAFKKQEMEIIDSKLELVEVYKFLLIVTSDVISENVTFNDGDFVGFTEDKLIKITSSEGRFVEGESLKLEV